MTEFEQMCEELKQEIVNSYESTITIPQAEALAGKFLTAQMQVTAELQKVDLDARMKKTGVKAVKAALYLNEAKKGDKKPSDVFLQAIVDQDGMVQSEQNAFDTAEAQRDALQNYYNIFREAHIFFRGQARSSYGG